ncbi:aromatic amino acid lyase, partial [Rhizobium ruizarguesonis]
TKSSQEDHVSMATWACRKTRQVVDNMPKILGVECLLAARAIFLTEEALGGYKLGTGSQALYDALRATIPFQQEDSYMPKQSTRCRPAPTVRNDRAGRRNPTRLFGDRGTGK